MQNLKAESLNFTKRKANDHDFARSIVALQLACGIDLVQARSACSEKRAQMLVKVVLALKKERQKGLSRHWSYDLNRHIALKQVLDFVRNG